MTKIIQRPKPIYLHSGIGMIVLVTFELTRVICVRVSWSLKFSGRTSAPEAERHRYDYGSCRPLMDAFGLSGCEILYIKWISLLSCGHPEIHFSSLWTLFSSGFRFHLKMAKQVSPLNIIHQMNTMTGNYIAI